MYMPQDGHCLASFEVIPPPKKLVFPRPKKCEISPLKTGCARALLKKKISDPFFFFFFFGCFCRKFCHADVDCRLSRTTSDPAQKSGKNHAKIAFFLFFRNFFDKIVSRRSRLSRPSRAPSRAVDNGVTEFTTKIAEKEEEKNWV